MKFLDQAKVYIRSGNGGAGCVSFHRAKYQEFGGPDGGNGGRGGDVWAEAVNGLNTLIDYRYQQHFKAQTGVHGMGRNRDGKTGDDIVLKVPAGTQIYEEDNETLICDLQESDRDRTMVSAITSLAHSLGLQVIAEHVDSQGSLEWLKGCGVDYVQGHFLGEPQAMSETDFARSRAA